MKAPSWHRLDRRNQFDSQNLKRRKASSASEKARATTLPVGLRKSVARERVKTAAELIRAVLLRSAIYGVVLFLLLERFQGFVQYGFLAVTAFAVVVMHEALHMIGMEASRTNHIERFRLFVVGYEAVNIPGHKALIGVILPFAVFFPFGFFLIRTAIPAFVAVGWAIIIMHAILLPIELGTIRSKSTE